MSRNSPIRVGTRGSKLAVAQTEWVISKLRVGAPGIDIELKTVQTTGDRRAEAPVLGDGVFVREIQHALLEGEVDMAVHSLKDMPTEPVAGLVIAAIPEREDARDALVGARLDDLAPGSRIGTGSPRRSAQLKRLRSDIEVVSARGNVPTRIEKVERGEYDAVMLAMAGLSRLGLTADEVFAIDDVLPAPGQGALAVETRDGDPLSDLGRTLHREDVRACVVAERHLLRILGGGCLLPVAAYASVSGDRVILDAAVTSQDGKTQLRAHGESAIDSPLGAAKQASRQLLNEGARDLLSI
ncbi:MAG: hydroxymethylbilane synthase [Actinobacteria bacterium]|nr:hydroxymethylbilane synthase [Actinomycetota bacterium]